MITIVNSEEVKRWIGIEVTRTETLTMESCKKAALKIMDTAKRSSRGFVRTGRYRASIHIETEDSQGFAYEAERTGEGFSGDFLEKPEKGDIFVGTNVVYAWKVEDKHRVFETAATEGQFYINRKLSELSKK